MVEIVNQMGLGSLSSQMGIEVIEASSDRVVARMPVAGNTQPYGILHGGASAVLAETIGSIGSAIHAGMNGRIAMGIELSCTHHKSVADGFVTAVATPLSLGRTLATWDITVTDDGGRRICTSRLTCLLRDAPN